MRSDGSLWEPGGAPDEEVPDQPPAGPWPDPGLFGADPTDPVLVPLPERRADALAELAGMALRSGMLPARGGTAATVLLTISLEGLSGRLLAAGLLDTDTVLPVAAALRLACDAGLIPAVMSGEAEPLHLGRVTRTVSSGLRRALVLRDRGCVFPHCAIPAGRCDAHHLLHWADGGATDLDNLCLLCPYHHRMAHRQHWQLHHRHGRTEFIPPTSIDPQQRPRTHLRTHHPGRRD